MTDLIKLTGLWEKKDKNGNTFFTGRLTPNSIVKIFKNTRKESENQPDFVMYISPNRREEQPPNLDEIPF